MFCPQCGFQNPDASNFCEKCGGHLGGAASSSAAPIQAHAAGAGIHVPKNPLSIAQMMMVFCVLLTIVIPVTGFYVWFIRGLSDTYGMVSAGTASQLFDNSNSDNEQDIGKAFLEVFTLRIALESPLLILSVYSGVRLWKKKPGALALAKGFLLALIVFLVCSHLVFPHFFGLSESYDTILALEFWLAVALLAACYSFLLVSKQVREYDRSPSAPVKDSKLA